ncbi:MAG: hypothetical protein JWO82_3270 [Akkermansiaceae bacterium]|nr:hypothetical protein [Akkermansiaceae bacterium]
MRPSFLKTLLGIAAWLITGAGSLHAAPPTNDNFAAATVMSGQFWATQGTLYGATSEANEPILTGFPNGPTAWWRWTAPVSGAVRVSTWGSEKGSLLAVYSGATLDTTRLIGYQAGTDSFTNASAVTFTATAGQSYSIQVLGTDYSNPTFITNPFDPGRLQLSLTPVLGGAFAPSNDNFAGATVISGTTADIVVDDGNATSETGEPGGLADARGNTVWLAWTAPSNGTWQIDTLQGDHDTITAVYTGTAVNALTRIDYSDDASAIGGVAGSRGGRFAFRAIAGQTYHIQIQGATLAGAPPDYGCVRVLFQPVQAPANDDFANAATLTGASPSAYGWGTFATREVTEPAQDKADESNSTWWQWTVPATGLMAVVQYNGDVDPYTGSSLASLVRLPYASDSGLRSSLGAVTDWYPVTAGTVIRFRGIGEIVNFGLRIVQPPANEKFDGRKTLTGATASDTVDTDYSGTVWFRWVAPATARYVISSQGSPGFMRVALFTGTASASLTSVGDEQLYGYDPGAYGRVYLNATAGTEYQIKLSRESSYLGLAHVNIRPVNPPANDAFAAATSQNGSAWTATGTNVDATSETNDPFINVDNGTSARTVWWRWIAPANGLFRLSTAGSSVDTIMGLYTGSALGALTTVATNSNAAMGDTGAVTFAAVSGTTYRIMLDCQSRQEGALKLSLAPLTAAPNDAFANRLLLSGISVETGGNVLGATLESGEPALSGATVGHSVWYEWVAPASGNAVFKVVAAKFTPAVGIFSGTTIGSLSPLVTSSGGGATTTEQTFLTAYPVSSGTSYKILVDGSPADNGLFRISVSMPAAPVNDNFASRSTLAGPVVHASANNEGATKQSGEPAHAGVAATYSVWWEWTAPSSGTVTIDTSGSAAQPRLAVYTGTAVNALTSVASDTIVFPETFSSVTFNAVAGTKYEIAADSFDRSRGDIALNIVSASSVPANDAFASATVWNGDQQEALFYPQGATAETGEPALTGRSSARSLWWKWTPATTRRASVWLETQSTTLLSRMVIYKGSALNGLTPVLAPAADVHWQRSQVDVLAGTTYYIVIDTPAGPVDPGWIKFGIEPVNGTSDGAYAITPDAAAFSESLTGASTANTQVAPSAQRQLWWAWTAEVNARMEWRVFTPAGSGLTTSVGSTSAFFQSGTAIAVPGSTETLTTFDARAGATYFFQATTTTTVPISVQLSTGVFQVPPSNDQSYRATPMAGASWSTPVTLGAESDTRLFWTWTAPSSGVTQISLNGTLATSDALLAYADGLTPITAGASSTNGGAPTLRLASAAGQHWTIVSRTGLKRLRSATLALIPGPGTPPANDSFLSPQVLASNWTSATGDVTFASCEPGERDHTGISGVANGVTFPPGRSVWYDWTPTVSGPATLRLDSTTDLAMHLYRGRTLQEWTDGDALPDGSHNLTTYVQAGQTYHIAVATRPYDEITAPFTLRFASAAPNDMLANAIVLSGGTATSSVDSTGATVETGEVVNGFDRRVPRATLWWKWTAPSTGTVRMDTLGSEFDTILAVFSSDPPDATARVAENDNATARAGVTASAVSFPAVAGQTYTIRVSRQELIGSDGLPALTEITGLAKLNISMSPAADPFARWLADRPALTGANANETADPDHDGISNLLELAMGSNPLIADAPHSAIRFFKVDGGWQAEASLDRNALESLSGGTPLEVSWQVSKYLINWQPGPVSQFVRRDGILSIERILLQPTEGSFVRLMVRDPR